MSELDALYTITTQAGVLSSETKAKLAGELTAFHSEYAGVPKNWVHIVFQDYAPGSGFTAGETAATAALTLLVRRYIKGQKYTLLSRKENLTLDGRKALKTLLSANKRLNIISSE
jgi:phenylpyruvate tautomerase PptA (4-oxalocrotonate tautomerase family)